jgi:hypothetical protein
MEKFIIGLVFGLSIQPLLDGLTSLCLGTIEMLKSYLNVVIARNNQKIARQDPEVKNRIGFDGGKENDL